MKEKYIQILGIAMTLVYGVSFQGNPVAENTMGESARATARAA